MKIYYIFFVLLGTQYLSAQNLKEILLDDAYEVEYVGIDFSKCKLVGTVVDFKRPDLIARDYFIKWNSFFYREPDKFNMMDALRKDEVLYSIEAVDSVNSNSDTTVLQTTKTPPSFTKEELQEMVSLYNYNPKKEISVVYIVNAMNKLRRQFVVNIVFFDSKTKEILYENELMGEPKGIGFRNYWLGGIKNILDITRGTEYRNWKRKYK